MRVKKVIISTAVIFGLMTGASWAGQIMMENSTGNGLQAFSTYSSTTNAYKVAYEVYNPQATNTMSSRGIVALELTGNDVAVNGPYTVTFRFPDSNAKFNIVGSQSNTYWLLVDNPTNPTKVYAASNPGVVASEIALTDTTAQSLGNLTFNGNAITTEDTIPNGGIPVYLIQAQISNGAITNPTNVSALLYGPSASCTTNPTFQLSATIAGANTNIEFSNVTFAYVTPEFSVSIPASGNDTFLQATLDTNSNPIFSKFISPATGNVQANLTEIKDTNFIQVTDAAANNADWIAYAQNPPFQSISFNINSTNSETLNSFAINGTPLTSATSPAGYSSSWQGVISNPASNAPYTLDLTVSGTATNNVTSWNLTNLTVTPNSGAVFCPPTTTTYQLGSWVPSGLEAMVPFVKYNAATGDNTYIKLYNRSANTVSVYAMPFNAAGSAPVMNLASLTPLTTIAANSSVQITGDQIETLLNNAGLDGATTLANGIPVKFLITVNQQADQNTAEGATTNNAVDPYIEGIVMNVTNGGTVQRSIPLEFRSWTNGSYQQ